jgi:hypothetical protein
MVSNLSSFDLLSIEGNAVVGLRPSFSAHVRPTASRGRLGEHRAPVRIPAGAARKIDGTTLGWKCAP